MALFLPGINLITWKEAQSDIDWGGIVLIAAGLSLGMLVFETGAARWLALLLFSPIGGLAMALRIFLAVLIVEFLKVFFSSNTATGVILIPMVIALAVSLELNPWYLAGPVAIATSLAFILVTSSPTNVIPYARRLFLNQGLCPPRHHPHPGDPLYNGGLYRFWPASLVVERIDQNSNCSEMCCGPARCSNRQKIKPAA